MTAVLTGTELQVRKDIARVDADRKAIRIWLGVVIFALFCLVLVGGATRLTDSGLSITQWKPIHGIIPPLTVAEWEEELELYRQIPEYQQINKGMSLDEFKFIFWWEWAHRLLARMIGLIFALPLAYFWIRERSSPACARRSSVCWHSEVCRALSAGGWCLPVSANVSTSASIVWRFI